MLGTGTLILADVAGSDHMGGWAWGMAMFGWLFMTAVVVLIAWLAWSSTRNSELTSPSGDRARELLDERYARGEIDRDEYLERRSDLNG